MDRLGCYDNRTVFESEAGRSHLLHEILPDRLTLEPQARGGIREYRTSHRTLFREIRVVPALDTWNEEVRNLDVMPVEGPVADAEFAHAAFDAIKGALYRAWNPAKFHVVLHSGGWDSRIVSECICRLREEHGDDWLGRVLFVEANGEAGAFKLIMRAQGWDESQFVVYNEGAEPLEYHAASLEFAGAWRRLNGSACYPLNLWWYPVAWMQELGVVPADDAEIQCISGYAGDRFNQAFALEKLVWPWFLTDYYLALSSYPRKVECVFPFYDLRAIREIMAYSSAVQTDNFRILILKHAAPRAFFAAKHPRALARQMYAYISPSLLEQAASDYEASWYGREVQPGVEPVSYLGRNEWWAAWSAASFCEHLRDGGYSIEVAE